MTQKAAPPGGEQALNSPGQRMASQAPGSEMRASREIVAENSAWIGPLREEMGRVIVIEFVSIDGVMEDPDGRGGFDPLLSERRDDGSGYAELGEGL